MTGKGGNLKIPQDFFRGGHGACFSDPDGYRRDIVWAPIFEFAGRGGTRSDA